MRRAVQYYSFWPAVATRALLLEELSLPTAKHHQNAETFLYTNVYVEEHPDCGQFFSVINTKKKKQTGMRNPLRMVTS